MSSFTLGEILRRIGILSRTENEDRGLNIPVFTTKNSNDGFFNFSIRNTPSQNAESSEIYIGVKNLYKSSHGFRFLPVEDVDAVVAFTEVPHEFDHADLIINEVADPDADEYTKQLARSEVVMAAASDWNKSSSYYREYYNKMPFEQRAFLESGKESLEFFRRYFPQVPADMIISDWYRGMGFYPYANCNGADDVLKYMEEQKLKVPYQKRPVDIDHPSSVFLRFSDIPEFRREYLNAPNGVEMDKVAVRYIARFAPQYLRGFPCLQKELGLEYEKPKIIVPSRGNQAMEKFGDIVVKSDAGKDIEYGDD